jgi:uncharacterized protein (DUF2249 family)
MQYCVLRLAHLETPSMNHLNSTPLLITGDTRLNKVLDAVPGALDYIVSLRPHDFERLRNPFMRKHMSPRISLRRVAAMARVPESEFLARLAQMSGSDVPSHDDPPEEVPQSPASPPNWMQGVSETSLHWVDVLPIDDVLGDPMLPINIAVRGMELGEVIGIRHRWEPQPLYDIWQKMGLEWYAQQAKEDEWHIFVHKPPAARPPVQARQIVVELRYIPPTDIEPRLVATFRQLRPGESLEVWAPPDDMQNILDILDAHFPGAYTWERKESTPDRVTLAIHPVGRQPREIKVLRGRT